MQFLSRFWYYLTSIVTLLTGFRQPMKIIAIFIGWPGALPVEVETQKEGWRFRVRSAMDVWIIKESCLDGDYLWASGGLEPSWRVLDIGAGLGDFTVYAALKCQQGVVHAYEPLEGSFGLLKENLALNGLSNVTVFQAAVASQPSQMMIASGEGAAVSTRFAKGTDGPNAVPAHGLAEVLDALPGRECDFMKLDCEGCEFDLLLNSAPETLARIHRISMECHEGYTDHRCAELVAYLREVGFRVQERANPAHGYLRLVYGERAA